MLQHLLYITAPSREQSLTEAMKRLKAKEPGTGSSLTQDYLIEHKLLEGISLRVSVLSDIDGVTPYLRQNPVDLLIYDERGDDIVDAVCGITRIRKDVKQLAEMWGPDFQFPISRSVVILNTSAHVDHKVFQLGRLNVRDVLVEPKNTALVLRWLKNVLYHGIMRTNQVGIALSGGAIEGFLYQVGVVHALNQAFTNRSFYDVDVISGVSSGSIVGTVIASKAPVKEVIKSLYGYESEVPPLKISILFDFSGFPIMKRFTKVSLQMGKTPISQWLSNMARSIPTGFFKGDRLEAYFETIIAKYAPGKLLKDLKTKLFIGVTDQDTFKHVILGKKPLDDILTSEAVRASASLPPLYQPKRIRDRLYIDGQITKSCNLEAVVEAGARLIFVIDPLKPFETSTPGQADQQGGFYGIIQMVKALVSTRFETSLNAMGERHPDVDFMIFQPDEECAKLMSGSPVRARFRTEIIRAAYQGTLRRLRERHHVYEAVLSRYGFKLKSIDDLRKIEQNYDSILQSASQGDSHPSV